MKTEDYWRGQVVLITGGSSGIGLALAEMLAGQGAHVWLLARDQARLAAALAAVQAASRSAGQRHGIVSADVADWTQTTAAIDRVIESAGAPDLLINSAGVARPGYVQDLTIDIFRQMMAVNYFGTVHVVKALLPSLIGRGSGHIVNISSLAGLIGVFGYTAYGASKYAVRGFSDVLRAELKPLGIAVSLVLPPDVDTPQLADENRYKPPETKALARGGGLLSAEEAAAAILKGVVRRRYLILPGLESKLIYGISSLAGPLQYPLMDWLIARAR